MPDWVDRVVAPTPGGSRNQTTFVVCNDAPSLVYLANLAAIVLHIWTSRIPDLDEPDFVIFDLDPGERCTLRTLSAVALTVQRLLEEIGLKVARQNDRRVRAARRSAARTGLLLRHSQGLCRAGRASCRGGARRSSHAAADDRQASAGGGLSRLRAGRIGQDDRRAVLGARARCRAGFDAVALVRGRSLRPAARRRSRPPTSLLRSRFAPRPSVSNATVTCGARRAGRSNGSKGRLPRPAGRGPIRDEPQYMVVSGPPLIPDDGVASERAPWVE